MTVGDVLNAAADRERVLTAAADLFEQVAGFMETVIPQTFETYQSASSEKEADALRRKHLQALRIRDDYRSSAKENREDVELLCALRQAAQQAASTQSGGAK